MSGGQCTSRDTVGLDWRCAYIKPRVGLCIQGTYTTGTKPVGQVLIGSRTIQGGRTKHRRDSKRHVHSLANWAMAYAISSIRLEAKKKRTS